MSTNAVTTSTTTVFYIKRNLFLIMVFGAAFIFGSSSLPPTEARTVPRSSSRLFRFPSSNEEYDATFKESSSDSTNLFLAKRTREHAHSNNDDSADESQGRNAIILSLDNNPIKAAVPQSSSGKLTKSDRATTAFSAQGFGSREKLPTEVLFGGGDLTDDEKETSDGHDDETKVYEDEVLLEALCPPNGGINGKENSTANTGLNSQEIPITSADSNHLRYDLQAGKCAHVGKREHCGKNMIFVAEIDSAAYGYCECDFENKILRKEGGIETAATTKNPTPLVFHPKTNACYRLYEQAYCSEGEWLVLSREKKGPVCERNRCSRAALDDKENSSIIPNPPSNRRRASKLLTPELWTTESSSKRVVPESADQKSANNTNGSTAAGQHADEKKRSFWVPLNGSGPCVKLFESSSQHCGEDEQVVFNVGDIVPSCGFVGRRIEGRAIIRNACPPGSYYSIIGRCQPDWDF